MIRIGTRRKRLVDDFGNARRLWRPNPQPSIVQEIEKVALGNAKPCGIYDLQHNQGIISIGRFADNPTSAADTVARCCAIGRLERCPEATDLLLEIDV